MNIENNLGKQEKPKNNYIITKLDEFSDLAKEEENYERMGAIKHMRSEIEEYTRSIDKKYAELDTVVQKELDDFYFNSNKIQKNNRIERDAHDSFVLVTTYFDPTDTTVSGREKDIRLSIKTSEAELDKKLVECAYDHESRSILREIEKDIAKDNLKNTEIIKSSDLWEFIDGSYDNTRKNVLALLQVVKNHEEKLQLLQGFEIGLKTLNQIVEEKIKLLKGKYGIFRFYSREGLATSEANSINEWLRIQDKIRSAQMILDTSYGDL